LTKLRHFRYQFDRVFNAEEDNTIVYRDVAFHVIESALSGFNSTIFAYGQTASGKTHTMMGTLEDQGIIRLAVDHIFDAIEQSHDKQFLLRVSYVEIYNEKVTDLLAEVSNWYS
jgi:centromeric protein E